SFKMSVGKVAITNEEMLSNEAIAHMKLQEFSCLSTEYIYCYLKNFHFDKLGTTSSIVTSINSKMIKDFIVLVPNEYVLSLFNKLIKGILLRKRNIESLNNNLYALIEIILSKMSKVELKEHQYN